MGFSRAIIFLCMEFVVLHLIPRTILGPGPEGIVMSQLDGECGLAAQPLTVISFMVRLWSGLRLGCWAVWCLGDRG